MGKVIALLFTILLAIASLVGYLVLNEKINAGERFIAEGQNNIEQQRPSFEAGKVDLADGKQKLSAGKKEYEEAHDNPFLVWADKWFNGGKGFAEGRKKIAEGEEKVAQGQDKVDVGKKQLDTGTLKVHQGMEKLKMAKEVRDACALGTVIFTLLSIVLGFFWRRSVAKTLMQLRAR
jgi:uncharacterized phage infection (PIP) family protein YhgE